MLSHRTYQKVHAHITRDDANLGLLFDAYNAYAEANNRAKIYDLDVHLLANMFEGRSHTAFYNALAHANFNQTDKYFALDGFGRIVTFTSPVEMKSPINMVKFAEWLGEDDRYQQFDFFVDMP